MLGKTKHFCLKTAKDKQCCTEKIGSSLIFAKKMSAIVLQHPSCYPFTELFRNFLAVLDDLVVTMDQLETTVKDLTDSNILGSNSEKIKLVQRDLEYLRSLLKDTLKDGGGKPRSSLLQRKSRSKDSEKTSGHVTWKDPAFEVENFDIDDESISSDGSFVSAVESIEDNKVTLKIFFEHFIYEFGLITWPLNPLVNPFMLFKELLLPMVFCKYAEISDCQKIKFGQREMWIHIEVVGVVEGKSNEVNIFYHTSLFSKIC